MYGVVRQKQKQRSEHDQWGAWLMLMTLPFILIDSCAMMVRIANPSPPQAWFPLNFLNSSPLSGSTFLFTHYQFKFCLYSFKPYIKIKIYKITYMCTWWTNKQVGLNSLWIVSGNCNSTYVQPWHHRNVFFISHGVTSLVLGCYITNNVVAEVTSHNISQWDILGPNSFVFRI